MEFPVPADSRMALCCETGDGPVQRDGHQEIPMIDRRWRYVAEPAMVQSGAPAPPALEYPRGA